MQEGTVAFLQMVKIAAAIQLHNQALCPTWSFFSHPTTGGAVVAGASHRRRAGRPDRLSGTAGL